MRLVADECVDGRLVAGLRASGHDVVAVRETSQGADDRSIVEMASRRRRILVTEDKDFGDLIVRHGLVVPGVVLLRYPGRDVGAVLKRLLAVIEHRHDDLRHLFVVVTPKRARIRTLRQAIRSV